MGVFLALMQKNTLELSLPHESGGVSCAFFSARVSSLSSPCIWGVSINDGGVDRVQMSSPCIWGVSLECLTIHLHQESSPCMWGCFFITDFIPHAIFVFPMYVGVFLIKHRYSFELCCLPHVYGGVSVNIGCYLLLAGSSLCIWGCFSMGQCFNQYVEVFPMYMRVFLDTLSAHPGKCGLPHVYGGVSEIQKPYDAPV